MAAARLRRGAVRPCTVLRFSDLPKPATAGNINAKNLNNDVDILSARPLRNLGADKVQSAHPARLKIALDIGPMEVMRALKPKLGQHDAVAGIKVANTIAKRRNSFFRSIRNTALKKLIAPLLRCSPARQETAVARLDLLTT